MPNPTPAEIDELGDLDVWYRSIKKKLDRRDALKARVMGAFGDSNAESNFEVVGKRYRATISCRELQRKIVNMRLVAKELGNKLFLQLASLTLKNLDSHVPTARQVALNLIASERTGPREVRVEALPTKNSSARVARRAA